MQGSQGTTAWLKHGEPNKRPGPVLHVEGEITSYCKCLLITRSQTLSEPLRRESGLRETLIAAQTSDEVDSIIISISAVRPSPMPLDALTGE